MVVGDLIVDYCNVLTLDTIKERFGTTMNFLDRHSLRLESFPQISGKTNK